jgi:peptide/nickel transport system substrate-binding protein
MVKRFIILVTVLLIASLTMAACSTPASSTPAKTTPPVSSTASKTTSPVTAVPPASATSTSTTLATASPKPSVTPAAGAQQYGGILKIIASVSPLYLGDPTLMTDSNSNMGMIPCLQALLLSDNDGKMQGILASDWTIAQDGKSITFNLGKGIKFQDGTDFNAQAAKWNLDRIMAANRTEAAQWNSVEVTGDYAIRLNLKSFQNTVLNGLEGTAGCMVSPAAAQKNGLEWIKLNPVGTGPYKFKSFSRDVSLEYSRFDDYWGGKPYLDGIQFTYIADGTTAKMSFQTGAADIISTKTDSVTADLVKQGYKLEKRPASMMLLIPDSKHANSPLADVKVRQAINYGFDRQGLANTLGYGLWEVVNQPAVAGQFGHVDNCPYTYDVTKAKQLMKESNYPNGFKTTFISSTTVVKDPLVAIQAQLADIGITAELKMVEYAAWNDLVAKGWDTNALLWASQGATDTNYVAFLDRYYGAKSNRYPVMARPAGLTELIDKALATPDYASEKSLCLQAVKMTVDDATTIPVYCGSAAYVLTNRVHDTYFSNVGGSGFRWSVEKAWLSK